MKHSQKEPVKPFYSKVQVMTPTRQDSLVQGELKGKVYLFNMICQSSPDLSILVTMTKHTQTFDEFLKNWVQKT